MSGVAARLLSGATTLSRPKTHATIGADPIVAIVVPSNVSTIHFDSADNRCTPSRLPSIPDAIIDATPTTLSW